MRLLWRGSRCCTTTIYAGNAPGSAASTSLIARKPPAEAAIATISKTARRPGDKWLTPSFVMGASAEIFFWASSASSDDVARLQQVRNVQAADCRDGRTAVLVQKFA